MEDQKKVTKRGRKTIHGITLNPDGLTPKQLEILRQLAKDRGVSVAYLRREIVREYLSQFDFTDEDQGLIGEENDVQQ